MGALISAKTILTSLSLFHITLGFFFLTNPLAVASQVLVYILGEATGMPYSRTFEAPSAPLAFLACVLASVGICDLATLSLPTEISLVHHWGLQAPLRLTLSACGLLYLLFFSDSSAAMHAHLSHYSGGYLHGSFDWGNDGLQNRVFFTFVLIEAISWLWIWVTLREERLQLLSRKTARRRSLHADTPFQ